MVLLFVYIRTQDELGLAHISQITREWADKQEEHCTLCYFL